MTIDSDIHTDIVIVGSGIGAMTAAIYAHDHGMTPIILEKSECYVGGSSARSGGALFVPNNNQQKAEGFNDSYQDAFNYLKYSTKHQISDDVLNSFIENAPEAIDYLLQHTELKVSVLHDYPDEYQNAKGSKKGGRNLESLPFDADQLGNHFTDLNPTHEQMLAMNKVMITNAEVHQLTQAGMTPALLMTKLLFRFFLRSAKRKKYARDTRLTMGNALMARLYFSLLQRGITVYNNTPATELILKDGRVSGVVSKQQGKQQRFFARHGVLLASGGFERNKAMREQHHPKPISNKWTVANVENTGDGINIGKHVGAQTDLMHEALWVPVTIVPDKVDNFMLINEKGLPGSVMVNSKGGRYQNEAQYYKRAVENMIDEHQKTQSAIPSKLIVDADFRKKYILGPILPGFVNPDIFINKYINNGFLKKSKTLKSLAKKINIKYSALDNTITQFNKHAANDEDPEFQRGVDTFDQFYGDSSQQPNPCIATIDKPPFYAIDVYPGDIATFGGLKVDATARVINTNNDIIPGLYATGNCSSIGMIGSLSSSLTFAYIAMKHLIHQKDTQ